MKQRTQKIVKVSTSLQKINKMQLTLNEIVAEQGETLNRIEDNFFQTKTNTKKTVDELKKTLKNEKTVKEKIMSCDTSVMCLSVWFIVACAFFLIDMTISGPRID